MTMPDEKIIVKLEKRVRPIATDPAGSTTVHGFIDYIVAMTDGSGEGIGPVLTSPTPAANHPIAEKALSSDIDGTPLAPSISGLFVIEAKLSTVVGSLEDHVPQVVMEMHACAKALG